MQNIFDVPLKISSGEVLLKTSTLRFLKKASLELPLKNSVFGYVRNTQSLHHDVPLLSTSDAVWISNWFGGMLYKLFEALRTVIVFPPPHVKVCFTF